MHLEAGGPQLVGKLLEPVMTVADPLPAQIQSRTESGCFGQRASSDPIGRFEYEYLDGSTKDRGARVKRWRSSMPA